MEIVKSFNRDIPIAVVTVNQTGVGTTTYKVPGRCFARVSATTYGDTNTRVTIGSYIFTISVPTAQTVVSPVVEVPENTAINCVGMTYGSASIVVSLYAV